MHIKGTQMLALVEYTEHRKLTYYSDLCTYIMLQKLLLRKSWRPRTCCKVLVFCGNFSPGTLHGKSFAPPPTFPLRPNGFLIMGPLGKCTNHIFSLFSRSIRENLCVSRCDSCWPLWGARWRCAFFGRFMMNLQDIRHLVDKKVTSFCVTAS